MKFLLLFFTLALSVVTDGTDLSMNYTAGGMLQGMQSGGDWAMSLQYDSRGLEIERVMSGGVVCRSQYDLAGRFHRQVVTSGGRETRRMRYDWSRKDRLQGIVDELAHHGTWFDYDSSDNLIGSTYDETEKLFRIPDAVGNLYRRPDRKDRKYGAGGRLLETENAVPLRRGRRPRRQSGGQQQNMAVQMERQRLATRSGTPRPSNRLLRIRRSGTANVKDIQRSRNTLGL